METVHKNCQSCGRLLKSDEMGGGTNADGSKSNKYCSKCCVKGRFKNPNMTTGLLQDLVKGKIMEYGFRRWLVHEKPKPQRWR